MLQWCGLRTTHEDDDAEQTGPILTGPMQWASSRNRSRLAQSIPSWIRIESTQTQQPLVSKLSHTRTDLPKSQPAPPAISLAGTLDAAAEAAAGSITVSSFSPFESEVSVYAGLNPTPQTCQVSSGGDIPPSRYE